MGSLLFSLYFTTLCFAQQARSWDADPPSSWGAPTNGSQLALRAKKQSFFTGETVAVSRSAVNGSAAPSHVMIPKSGWLTAEFNIRKAEGGPLIPLRPPKDHFDQLKRWGLGHSISRVQPGAVAYLGMVDLSVLFDMSPGTYHVQALWRETNRAGVKTPHGVSDEITNKNRSRRRFSDADL